MSATITSVVGALVYLDYDKRFEKVAARGVVLDTRAHARTIMVLMAFTRTLASVGNFGVYVALGMRKIISCTVNDGLAIIGDSGGFSLFLGSREIDAAAQEITGSCLTAQSVAEISRVGEDSTASSISDMLAGVYQLPAAAILEGLVQTVDVWLAWCIGVVDGFMDIAQTADWKGCKTSRVEYTDTANCVCGDIPHSIPSTERSETFSDGAWWCSGLLLMTAADGTDLVIFNPFSLEALLQDVDFDAYLKCLAGGAPSECSDQRPMSPNLALERQGVELAQVVTRCRANYQQKKWDDGALLYGLFTRQQWGSATFDAGDDEFSSLRLRIRRLHASFPELSSILGALSEKRALCLQGAFEANDLDHRCHADLRRDYFSYESGNPDTFKHRDACQSFSGLVSIEGQNKATLPPILWSGSSSNRVAVATRHLRHTDKATQLSTAQRKLEHLVQKDIIPTLQEIGDELTADKIQQEAEIQAWSVEGDEFHQMVDCVLMGPFSAADLMPTTRLPNANSRSSSPLYHRGDKASRKFSTNGGTGGSQARKSLIGKLLKHTGQNVHESLGEIVQKHFNYVRQVFLSADGSNGVSSNLLCACPGGARPSLECCSSESSASNVDFNARRALGNIWDIADDLIDDAFQEVMDSELLNDLLWTSEDFIDDSYEPLPTKEEIEEMKRLQVFEGPVFSYDEYRTNQKQTLWWACVDLLVTSFFTLPIHTQEVMETLGLEADDMLLDADIIYHPGDNVGDFTDTVEGVVHRILFKARQESPVFWSHVHRYIATDSVWCEGFDNSAADSTVHTLQDSTIEGATIQAPTVGQVRYAAQNSEQPASELSNVWGLIHPNSHFGFYNGDGTGTYSEDHILANGPGGVRVSTMSNPTVPPKSKLRPGTPGQRFCSSNRNGAFPDDMRSYFHDVFFPMAHSVAASPATAACSRWVIETAMDYVIQLGSATKRNIQTAELWKERCIAQLELRSVCELREVYSIPRSDSGTRRDHCKPATIELTCPENTLFHTHNCLVRCGNRYYDPCECNAECNLNNIACPYVYDTMVVDRNRLLHSLYVPETIRIEESGDTDDYTDILHKMKSQSPADPTDDYLNQLKTGIKAKSIATEDGMDFGTGAATCDDLFDYWPESAQHPTGYHPSTACTRKTTNLRGFYDWMSTDENGGVQIDSVRHRNATEYSLNFGASHLVCDALAYHSAPSRLASLHFNTRWDANARADPSVPRRAGLQEDTAAFSHEGRPSFDPTDTPLHRSDEFLKHSAGLVRGLYLGIDDDQQQTLRNTWPLNLDADYATAHDHDGTCEMPGVLTCWEDAHCHNSLTCLRPSETQPGVCSPQNSCYQHRHCPDSKMCTGTGECVDSQVVFQNALHTDISVQMFSGSPACSQDTYGSSPFQHVPSFARDHGMCGFRKWNAYNDITKLHASELGSVIEVDDYAVDLTDQSQEQLLSQTGVLYTNPHVCDRSYQFTDYKACHKDVGGVQNLMFTKTRTQHSVKFCDLKKDSNEIYGFLSPYQHSSPTLVDVPSSIQRCKKYSMCPELKFKVEGVLVFRRLVRIAQAGNTAGNAVSYQPRFREYCWRDAKMCGGFGYLMGSTCDEKSELNQCVLDEFVLPFAAVFEHVTELAVLRTQCKEAFKDHPTFTYNQVRDVLKAPYSSSQEAKENVMNIVNQLPFMIFGVHQRTHMPPDPDQFLANYFSQSQCAKYVADILRPKIRFDVYADARVGTSNYFFNNRVAVYVPFDWIWRCALITEKHTPVEPLWYDIVVGHTTPRDLTCASEDTALAQDSNGKSIAKDLFNKTQGLFRQGNFGASYGWQIVEDVNSLIFKVPGITNDTFYTTRNRLFGLTDEIAENQIDEIKKMTIESMIRDGILEKQDISQILVEPGTRIIRTLFFAYKGTTDNAVVGSALDYVRERLGALPSFRSNSYEYDEQTSSVLFQTERHGIPPGDIETASTHNTFMDDIDFDCPTSGFSITDDETNMLHRKARACVDDLKEKVGWIVGQNDKLEISFARSVFLDGFFPAFQEWSAERGFLDRLFAKEQASSQDPNFAICFLGARGPVVMNPFWATDFDILEGCDTLKIQDGRRIFDVSCKEREVGDPAQFCGGLFEEWDALTSTKLRPYCRAHDQQLVPPSGRLKAGSRFTDTALCEEVPETLFTCERMFGTLHTQQGTPKIDLYHKEQIRDVHSGVWDSRLFRGQREVKFGNLDALKISDRDIAGHVLVFRIEGSNEATAEMFVEYLPLAPYSPSQNVTKVSSWMISVESDFEWQHRQQLTYLLNKNSVKEYSSWTCPLQWLTTYSDVASLFHAAKAPSPLRNEVRFAHIVKNWTYAHPTVSSIFRIQQLKAARFVSDSIACIAVSGIGCSGLFNATKTFVSALDTWKTVEFIGAESSRCNRVLDWPLEKYTLRDEEFAETNIRGSDPGTECIVADRFPGFQIGLFRHPVTFANTSRDVFTRACRMGRLPRITSRHRPAHVVQRCRWKQGELRCLHVNFQNPNSPQETTTVEETHAKYRQKRPAPRTGKVQQNMQCSQCEAQDPKFLDMHGQRLHLINEQQQLSVGKPMRISSERMISATLRRTLCGTPEANCMGLSQSAWSKKNGQFLDAFLYREESENLFIDPRENTQTVQAASAETLDDAEFWSRPWVFCDHSDTENGGCRGSITKDAWTASKSSRKTHCKDTILSARDTMNRKRAPVHFCLINSATEKLCQKVVEWQANIADILCRAGGACGDDQFFYSPTMYNLDNRAFVHDSVASYYGRVGGYNAEKCTADFFDKDEYSTEIGTRAQCSAFFFEQMKEMVQSLRRIVHKVVKVIYYTVNIVIYLMQSIAAIGNTVMQDYVQGMLQRYADLWIEALGEALLSIINVLKKWIFETGFFKTILELVNRICEAIQLIYNKLIKKFICDILLDGLAPVVKAIGKAVQGLTFGAQGQDIIDFAERMTTQSFCENTWDVCPNLEYVSDVRYVNPLPSATRCWSTYNTFFADTQQLSCSAMDTCMESVADDALVECHACPHTTSSLLSRFGCSDVTKKCTCSTPKITESICESNADCQLEGQNCGYLSSDLEFMGPGNALPCSACQYKPICFTSREGSAGFCACSLFEHSFARCSVEDLGEAINPPSGLCLFNLNQPALAYTNNYVTQIDFSVSVPCRDLVYAYCFKMTDSTNSLDSYLLLGITTNSRRLLMFTDDDEQGASDTKSSFCRDLLASDEQAMFAHSRQDCLKSFLASRETVRRFHSELPHTVFSSAEDMLSALKTHPLAMAQALSNPEFVLAILTKHTPLRYVGTVIKTSGSIAVTLAHIASMESKDLHIEFEHGWAKVYARDPSIRPVAESVQHMINLATLASMGPVEFRNLTSIRNLSAVVRSGTELATRHSRRLLESVAALTDSSNAFADAHSRYSSEIADVFGYNYVDKAADYSDFSAWPPRMPETGSKCSIVTNLWSVIYNTVDGWVKGTTSEPTRPLKSSQIKWPKLKRAPPTDRETFTGVTGAIHLVFTGFLSLFGTRSSHVDDMIYSTILSLEESATCDYVAMQTCSRWNLTLMDAGIAVGVLYALFCTVMMAMNLSILIFLTFPVFIILVWTHAYGYSWRCGAIVPTCVFNDMYDTLRQFLPHRFEIPQLLKCADDLSDVCLSSRCRELGYTSWHSVFATFAADFGVSDWLVDEIERVTFIDQDKLLDELGKRKEFLQSENPSLHTALRICATFNSYQILPGVLVGIMALSLGVSLVRACFSGVLALFDMFFAYIATVSVSRGSKK